MKVLILGASSFLGGILYKKMKEETDFWVLGTYYESKKDKELIKLDVTNQIEVNTFLQHFNPDVIVWCLWGKTNEEKLVNEGLSNVLDIIKEGCKFVFISTNAFFLGDRGDFSEKDIPSNKSKESSNDLYLNAKIVGEKLVEKLSNYIIIRPGVIYGEDFSGKWDISVSKLIEELTVGRKMIKTSNSINTFVEVNVLSDAIIKLIETNYRGVIH